MKTTKLFDQWRGMAPDNSRDAMNRGEVWLMRDYIPRVLGSLLESRNPWLYYVNGPLNGPVRAQKWVSTLGLNHHLAVTPNTLYNLDVPGSPRVVTALGGYGENPMASLYEFVGIPRLSDQLPVFVKYTPGSSVETVLTTHASTPKARHIEAWNAYFVLANFTDATGPHPSRVAWLEPGFPLTGTTTPVYDTKAWWDTSNDVTALARTRTSLLCFHPSGVERLRGGIPPGTNRQTDLWMEPLKGLGGCTHPHTISYWNDNVLFCDGRGAYLTDGTEIRDLTAQGGVSRKWRERYTSTMLLAGGVYADFWVICALESTGTFVDCWICDLYARKWIQFTNIPVASFVTAYDTKEKVYGGTWDGKLIDLSRAWDEADVTTSNVDANGVSVLPQLETAWYAMTKNYAMKRAKNAELALDLDEDAGALNVYVCEQVQPRTGADWKFLKTIRMTDLDGLVPDARGLVRRRIPLGYEGYGFAFKLETTGTLRNLKLYDFAVEGPIPREESYA